MQIIPTVGITEALLGAAGGGFLDPRGHLYDSDGFGWLARRMGYYTTLDDRLDGRYRPVYDNELDLKAVRSAAWLMDTEVPVAKAMKNRLVDYTIASGFDWDITHEDPRAEQVLKRVVEVFMRNCDWTEVEGESFEREIVDGEFIAEIVASSGEFSLAIYEGDALTEPLQSSAIEEWRGIEHPASWSFGVHTRRGTQRPLGYHIVRDTAGSDWDYVPAERFVHWKRNVPRNAKRGASDHYTTHKWLGFGDKVLSSTAQGAAIQASIAYIVEHASTTTASQAANLAAARSNVVVQRDPITGQNGSQRRIKPGQVIDVPAGQKYHSSLLGSNASTIYIEVMEALFRLTGTVYAFPEHMLTGYAGNNNRASSETAESPFLQGRARDQRTRAARLERLIRQVLRVYCERGRGTDRPGVLNSWEDCELGLSVTVNVPDIISRDEKALTDALIAQADRGWVSNRQATQLLKRDYDDVQEQLQTEREEAIELEQKNGTRPGFQGKPASQAEIPASPQGGVNVSTPAGDGEPVAEGLRENCGTGNGGFKPGNKCSKSGAHGAAGGSFRPHKAAPKSADKYGAVNLSSSTSEGRYMVSGRKLTDARWGLHQDITNEILNVPPVPKGEQRIATVVGGGTASGKSSLLGSGKVAMPSNSAVINADDIKERLPEYKEIVDSGYAHAAAGFVHHESVAISKRAMKEGLARGLNVTFDGTGDQGVESMARRVGQMKAAGLRVEATYVSASVETAKARAAKRAKETGRYVPDAIIEENHRGVSTTLPAAIERGIFDKWQLWDTDGADPILVAEGDAQSRRLANADAWAKFLRKGGEGNLRQYKGLFDNA